MIRKIILLALLTLTLVIPGAQAQFPGYPPVNAVQIGHGSAQPPGWDMILGTMAPQNANSVAITGGAITGMANPVNGTDVANKAYVDTAAAGLFPHQAARLATAASLPTNTYANGTGGVGATLTANANGALSVDGVAVAVNDRIIVKNEAAGVNNGIYAVTATGSGGAPYVLTSATDDNTIGTVPAAITAGTYIFTTAGVTLLNTAWVQVLSLSAIGTSPISFNLFAASAVSSVNGVAGPITLQGATGNITTTTVTTAAPNITVSTATVMPFYLGGCTMSNNPIAPLTLLDINKCTAADSTNAVMINVATALTKSINGLWAPGNGANAMGATLTVAANTWYHVCLSNNGGGTPDYWFDTDAICDHRPAGITDPLFRRIGSFKTNSAAQLWPFQQVGDNFYRNTVNIISAGWGNYSNFLIVADVPTGVIVQPWISNYCTLESKPNGNASSSTLFYDNITRQVVPYWTSLCYAGGGGPNYTVAQGAMIFLGPPTFDGTLRWNQNVQGNVYSYTYYAWGLGYLDRRGQSN